MRKQAPRLLHFLVQEKGSTMTKNRPEIRTSTTHRETVCAAPDPSSHARLWAPGPALTLPGPACRLSRGQPSDLGAAAQLCTAIPGAQAPQWEMLPQTHPSPHWSPQQVSKSSADTSTLTRPLVRTQIRSEMASTAPNACRRSPAW